MSKKIPEKRQQIRRHVDRILISRLQSLLETCKIMNATLELDRLLELIIDLTSKNLNADHCTLYLIDEEKGEIWSKVLHGEEGLHIRLPLGKGIAGYVACSGENVNISDAYQDSRFHNGVDKATGYNTKTMLCIPMRNRNGKIIGVIQVLNRKDKGLFTVEDERFLEAMSTHVALAIENALLYEEAIKRRQLEEQLRQSQKMEAIGMLASGVAHDFNNLLTIINNYSGMLQSSFNTDDPRWMQAEEILKAGEQAATLTRQLLAFSRKQVREPKVLNLNEIVDNIAMMLRHLIGENINIVIQLESELGQVKADVGQIEQIIMNLAVNARDAMPKGGKLIIETANVVLDDDQTCRQVDLQPGPYVMLKVSDTGIGIDEDTLSQIFDPFFTTKGPGMGTGLGLSTVYGIVKQNGGDILVQSQPGQGATFQVYLPCTEEFDTASTPTTAPGELPLFWGLTKLTS